MLLTITNPMHVAMKVVLSALPQDAATYPHRVTIVTPSFELGASSELWDEGSLVAAVPSMFIERESKVTKRIAVEGHRSSQGGGSWGALGDNGGGGAGSSSNSSSGIYQRGLNWCTIAVEVVPSKVLQVLEVPLFVSFSFKVPSAAEEKKKEEGKREKAKEGASKAESGSGVEDANEGADKTESSSGAEDAKIEDKEEKEEEEEEDTISIGFWAVLGVGKIAQ